jgi:hypothetical protein
MVLGVDSDRSETNMDRPVAVYWATIAQDAHLVSALLADSGIDARVVGETPEGGGAVPRYGLRTSLNSAICVWVVDRDRARALEIISGWENQRGADEAAAWKCAQCGEAVEGNFDVCWKCQSPRPKGSSL